MQLWICWWEAIWLLRPAFSRLRTFMWFATCVAGLSVRAERMGVTSIVRGLGLRDGLYDNLLDCFHSTGVNLDILSVFWTQVVLKLFPGVICVNGRIVLVGDGIKVAKQGRKMPAVKLLHQASESNAKAEYIMGHSFQAVSVLARAANSVFSVPLAARIHEGVVCSNRDKRSLLDKMIGLLDVMNIKQPFYFVADAYYASGRMVNALLKRDNHLVTRVRSNAVAFEAHVAQGKRSRGRPKVYGKKVLLRSLFSASHDWDEVESPVYGEKGVVMSYQVRDLLWRPAGVMVRFVAVCHPSRGRCLLMSTDIQLTAAQIIELYGLRFKIELAFKQAIHVVGAFSYHFWMKEMKPLSRRNGNQYLHRESEGYREGIKRKIHAYHVFVQAGLVAQGLLQYLSACHHDLVWKSFGSWLRTIRPGLAPSELVVATAMRHSLPDFLLDGSKLNNFAKFIYDRQDFNRMDVFRRAS